MKIISPHHKRIMPIVRVDDWLLFPGNPHRDRPMTKRERLAWKLGRRTIKHD